MESVRAALEVTIGSARCLRNDEHAALLSLCRLLADQIDSAGPDASSRITAAYLSSLKDLQRAISGAAKESTGGKLAQLRSVQGGQSTKRTARRPTGQAIRQA